MSTLLIDSYRCSGCATCCEMCPDVFILNPLTGKAELKQDDNKVNGDIIRYDIQKQQMIAQSSKGSRVKTIFLPQEIDEFNKAGKP